jgi:glucose-1-phosphate thymidylyltransferase
MIAVLLCAGYATRLHPLTENFPKPLLPVAGRPVIDYLLDQIDRLAEIDVVHVVTNAKFYAHFSRWAAQKEKSESAATPLIVHNDGTSNNASRLGAVADLLFVLEKVKTSQPLLVGAADNIFRFSIEATWRRFLSANDHLVIALPQTDPQKLPKTGVLELGDQDRVLRLHEKPSVPPSTWSCPPLYFLQPSAGNHLGALLAAGTAPDAPGYFIDYLCRRERVLAHKVKGSRLDIGDLDAYRSADRRLRSEPLFIFGNNGRESDLR